MDCLAALLRAAIIERGQSRAHYPPACPPHTLLAPINLCTRSVKILDSIRSAGPGALVAAAFIGPGTVTVCTLAGANFGYALLWALLFATFATIVFQEMAGRLGTIAQQGLGEALRESFATTYWKWPIFSLIVVALYAGNAAYEAGNLSGAALGVETIFGASSGLFTPSVLCIAVIAGTVLLCSFACSKRGLGMHSWM